MKVRRNVFTNMSGPHLPVAKFPNTNTEVTNTKSTWKKKITN